MNRSAPTRPAAARATSGPTAAVEDKVAQDVTGKEEKVLLHEADQPAQLRRVQFPDVHTIHGYPAPFGIIEPQEQADDGRLPGPGVPDKCDSLTRTGPEGDPLQEPSPPPLCPPRLRKDGTGHT